MAEVFDNRRVFTVPKPDFSDMEKLISEVPYNHDGLHIELFYNLIFSQQDITLPDHLRPVTWVLGDKNIDAAMLIISPGAGKEIADSTPVLTSNRGWVTHGELKIGDYVFSPSGNPIKVLATIPQPEPANIEVEFMDGSIIKVHPNHEWTLFDFTSKKWKTLETHELLYRTQKTKQITLKTGLKHQSYVEPYKKPIKLIYGKINKRNSHCRFHLPSYEALQYPETFLSIHPYVLGAWLGDGTSLAGRITYSPKDLEVAEEIKKHFNLNLLDNKCIPSIYLKSSIDQRLNLLAGLIDTDGTVNKHGQVSFSNTNETLIKDVEELIRSFGWRVSKKCELPKLSTSGINGTKNVYVLKFSPTIIIPLKIPRKYNRLKPLSYKRRIGIKDVRESNPEAGMCIQVDSKDGLYLVGRNLIPTHNSLLCDVAWPCYEIGYDPTTSIMGVSSGADLMVDFLQTSMGIIEENEIYKLLFPNVIPDENSGWSTSRGIFVKRPATGQVSPSYQATGYGSRKITGKHAKVILIDDIHDQENAGTADQIEKVEDFFYKTLIGRQDPKGSRMIMVGRRWAEDDLYGRLKKSGDWLTMTLASIRETSELYYDMRIPAGLSCIFNDFQAKETVEDIKVVYGENTEQPGFYWKGMVAKYKEALLNKKNKPAIYETVYQSNPEAVGSKIFRAEDFQDFYLPEGIELGRNSDQVLNFMGKMQFDMILQSWDTGLTAESRNDPSCCYTIGIRSCGEFHRGEDKDKENTLDEMPFHYDIYVLDEWYGRLEIGDLEREAVNYFNMWNPNQVIVENSIAGIPLIQNLSQFSISVVPVKVQNISKKSRSINGANAGSAQGWSRSGRIFIPRNAPWANELLKELDDFSGAKGKRDDRVDALVQAVNFSIDFGVLNRELPPGWRTEKEIQARMQSIMAPNHPFMQIPHMMDNQVNVFYGYCGTCKMFDKTTSTCKLHKRKVTKLDSCYAYDAETNQDAKVKVADILSIYKKQKFNI